MEVQGPLGNLHKLQTSWHRPRILIVVFELQQCIDSSSTSSGGLFGQFGFPARPIHWFLCMINSLFLYKNTGDVHS